MVDLRKSPPTPTPTPPTPLPAPPLSTFFHLPLPSLPFILGESSGRGKKEKRREEKKRQPFDIICSINNTFSTAPPRRRRRHGSSINKAARRTLYRAGGAHAKKKQKKEKRERETADCESFYENSLSFLSASRAHRQTLPSVRRPPVPNQAAVSIKGAASVVFQLIACLPPPSFPPPLCLPPPPSRLLGRITTRWWCRT